MMSVQDKGTPSVKELVDKHINNLDEKGKLQLPDDMPEVEKELIRQAKRTRDAQSALSKVRQQALEAEARAKALEEVAKQSVPSDFKISDEELRALEEIKFKDPDEYRLRVNALEQEAARK
jgi:hypothetical protein